MLRRPAFMATAVRRAALSRLLSTAGPVLLVACPAAVLAQIATNTARISLPSGLFETVLANNEATDSDALLAAIAAVDDVFAAVQGGIDHPSVGNILANDHVNGAAADLAAVSIRLLPGASPPGVTLDLVTGNVAVSAAVPAGTYHLVYEVCERSNPANCVQGQATVVVTAALSTVAGTVYDDRNGDQKLDPGENRRSGWIVEVIRDGAIVAAAVSDSQGNYRIEGLASGADYAIRFTNPDNRVVYQVIAGVTLASNTVVVDQNLPLDPSGVVYDSITRAPIRNAIVTMVGAGGAALPAVCFLAPSQQTQATDSGGNYRFDMVPGAASLCPVTETVYTIVVTPPAGYSAPSTVLPAEIGAFDPTGMSAPVMIGQGSAAPDNGERVRWYPSFRLAHGDPDVIFNHIPLDPFTSRMPLVVTKTSVRRSANVGDLIPYTITVRNAEAAQRGAVDVIDILPPGLKYVPGSALVNGIAAEPQVQNRELRWERQTIPGNGTVTYQLTVVVGAGVTAGDRVNTGVARNDLNDLEISNRGQAVVSIVPSAVFDCAELIGKVYNDLNGNGHQDQGEPGVAGARLATVNGELITTDTFGRYHIACAGVPDAQIGSNFVLKLDLRSIAQGYAPTADNPQSIRLTRGKISELNFGVQRTAATVLDLDDSAFDPGSAVLQAETARTIAALRPAIAVRLLFQITYRAQPGEDWTLAERRVAVAKAVLAELFIKDWSAPAPAIEVNVTRTFGIPGAGVNP